MAATVLGGLFGVDAEQHPPTRADDGGFKQNGGHALDVGRLKLMAIRRVRTPATRAA